MIDKDDSGYGRVLEFTGGSSSNVEPHVTSGTTSNFDRPSVPDYEVLRRIGSGEFGDVWLVRNELDRQYYAMKTLHEGFGIELDAIREFKRRVAESPYIVPIGHVGESNGVIYYLMPLADNALTNGGLATVDDYEPMTLAEFVNRNGKLSASKVIDVASCVLQGLVAIHSAGAVHRDVKAENILQFDGEWRLADPGLLTSSQERKDSIPSLGSRKAAETNDTHLDIRSVALTLERIYDLRDEAGASKTLLMETLRRAKADEIDPNRFHSAQQMLCSMQQAKSKLSNRISYRLPLLIASHLLVGCLTLSVGWQFALGVDRIPAEHLFRFTEMKFETKDTSYEACSPISFGETIYDVGFHHAGSCVCTNVFVESTAKYELSTRAFFGCQRGIFQLKIDGEPVGQEFDMYAPKNHDHYRTVYHDRLDIAKGWHTLKYELVSSNELAEHSNGAFVNLRLTPIEE